MSVVGVDFTEIDREDFRELLSEIVDLYMPFGKFGPKGYPPRGVPVMDLPPEYLAWFAERGFPGGRLGELMLLVFEIKQHGSDAVFQPLRARNGGRYVLRKRRSREFDFKDEPDQD